MSIGIQLTGKDDRISASVFIRSLANFLDLIRDVDSVVSHHSSGSVRWEVVSLKKSSPAEMEISGVSRLKKGDYSQSIQFSVVDGIHVLSVRPEQPENYSYSALDRALDFVKYIITQRSSRGL